MLRLTLLAHAPTAAQRQFRFAADEPIEPLPADFPAELGDFDRVIRGPERRNGETASAFGLLASPCDELRAWSSGAWVGRALDWLAEHDPEGLRAWHDDPSARPHGGESLLELLERVRHWVDGLTASSGRWLVIADASVLRAIVLHVLDAPPASFWRLDIPPLTLSVVQHAGAQWRLRSLALEPTRAATLDRGST